MPHRIVPHLSPARLRVYEDACASRAPADVGALYEWQLELHGAWHPVLGVVEMLLRHALDTALADWNIHRAGPGGGHRDWLQSAARPLDTRTTKMAPAALKKAQQAVTRRAPTHPRRNAPVTHDDLVAQLTFGDLDWLLPHTSSNAPNRSARSTGLTGVENLWLHGTAKAFPHHAAVWAPTSTGSPTTRLVRQGRHIGDVVSNLHRLRNRVFHHEQTLAANHPVRLRDALDIARAIDPAAAASLEQMSTVLDVVARRP